MAGISREIGQGVSPSESGGADPSTHPSPHARGRTRDPPALPRLGDPSSAEIAKNSWAESLRPTHSLYPSDFRRVTPVLDRPPPKTRRAPCSPRPVFIDRFWHRGSPVPPVRAQCAQLRWWAFCCSTSRVTMPHTILRLPTVKARTGLSRSTIYLRVSRRHLSRPRAPRGPCRGLDRGRGARVAHRADRATPADRARRAGLQP